MLTNVAATAFIFACDTRLGSIRLSGSGDDTYAADRHPLLIVELGGNDIYLGGAASGGPELPVGLL